MNDLNDGKLRARRTWGSSPTGWTSAKGFEPGTREFFERALKFRSEYEQPWLPDVVPFHAMLNKRVLEIGFGPGYDALTFMQNGAIYSGVDITPENIERTRKHLGFYGLTPDVREGDAEALPFPDETFDVVYSNGVLHHVPSVPKAFSEAARVLKPGGELYVLLYHRNSVFYRLGLPWTWLIESVRGKRESFRDRVRRIEANAAGETPIVNVYSRQEAVALASNAGLRVLSVATRKVTYEDLPHLPVVHRLYRTILPAKFLNHIGKRFGWYVIVRAKRD